MRWFSCQIMSHTQTQNIHILRLKPISSGIMTFFAGQYVYIRNPKFQNPEEKHPFSIASSPEDETLEFCMREYGNWTKKTTKLRVGDMLDISSPQGNFTFDTHIASAVFLCGGVGIAPVMSILRDHARQNKSTRLTVLYGSRTPDAIVYKNQLASLSKQLPNLTIKHILSDVSVDKKWKGYHGFITKNIIEKETNLSNNTDWFITGPPIFIDKMIRILDDLGVKSIQIHHEQT